MMNFKLLIALTLLLAACSSTPDAHSLEDIEDASIVEEPPVTVTAREPIVTPELTDSKPAPVVMTPGETPDIAIEGTYEALKHKSTKGGAFTFLIPGTMADVAAMLWDFDQMAGHRAWAQQFDVIEQDEESAQVRWHFEGKAGVNPKPVLQFQVRSREPDFVIRYRIVEEDFGLAAFFGDYRLRPIEGRNDQVEMRQRVYIDSGLWIANASEEEIEAGLREDAVRLCAWSRDRQAQSAASKVRQTPPSSISAGP